MSGSNMFKREPFQFTARADWQNGQLQTEVIFNVPNKKRLVIENISATHECPIAQDIISTQVRTSVNNIVAWHSVFVPKTGTFENRLNVYSGGQYVRIYAEPGNHSKRPCSQKQQSMHLPLRNDPGVHLWISASGQEPEPRTISSCWHDLYVLEVNLTVR